MRPFVVEFIGPMGAGKSTVASLVIDRLRKDGLACPTREETAEWRARCGLAASNRNSPFERWIQSRTLLSYLRWLCRYPTISIRTYNYALSVRPRSRKALQRSKAIMAWRQLFERFIRGSRFDVVVLDEGPLQYSHSVATSGWAYSSTRLRHLVGRIVREWDHTVVHLSVSSKVALERIRRRADELRASGLKSWRFENETIERQERKAQMMVAVINEIASCASLGCSDRLIRIDAMQSADESGKAIFHRLLCRVHSAEGTHTVHDQLVREGAVSDG